MPMSKWYRQAKVHVPLKLESSNPSMLQVFKTKLPKNQATRGSILGS